VTEMTGKFKIEQNGRISIHGSSLIILW